MMRSSESNSRTITISQDGTISYLDLPMLSSLESAGLAVKRRASQVHPVGRVKRSAFYLLRGLFGERGRVSDWTRNWSGKWEVDLAISGGPKLGPFAVRAEAIRAEEQWLEDNKFNEAANGGL
jgi:hypothetical protein